MKVSSTEGARLSDWAKQGLTADIDQSELLERAFRHAAIGMALVEPAGGFLKVNEALCSTLGYNRDELMTLDLQVITFPDDLERSLDVAKRLLEGEVESDASEMRYLHKDGKEIWGLASVTLTRSTRGAPRFFIVQIQDISARKQAESRMAEFFAVSPDMLAIAGTSGHLEMVNPAWEAQLGWSSEELTSRPFLEFVHPDDQARTQNEAEIVYAGQPSLGFRNRYLARDGSYHSLEWNSHLTREGKVYCVARDVSLRDQAERELRHTKLLLEATLANIEDGVALLDAERNLVLHNRAYAALFGLDESVLCGMTRAQFLAHVRGLVEDPEKLPAEIR